MQDRRLFIRPGLARPCVALSAATLAALAGACGSTPTVTEDPASLTAGLASLGTGAAGPELEQSPADMLAAAGDAEPDLGSFIAELEALGHGAESAPATEAPAPEQEPEQEPANEPELAPEPPPADFAQPFRLAAAEGPEAAEVAPEVAEPAPAAEVTEQVAVAEPEPEPEPAPAPPLSPEEQLAEHLDGAAELLAGEVWATEPFRRALAAELVALLQGAEGPAVRPPLLTEGETLALDGLGETLRGMLGAGEPLTVAAVQSAIAEAFPQEPANPVVRIARVELCSRVAGYGEFDRLPTTRFLAGQANRMIAYVELEGLEVRSLDGLLPSEVSQAEMVQAVDGLPEPVRPDDRRYVVESSVQVQLFEQGGLNVWNTTTETYRRETRTSARDNHRIRVITLPPNLSVGRYDLKVVVRDEIGGGLAETVIPVELVADRSLLTHVVGG